MACTVYAVHREYIVTVVAIQVPSAGFVQASRLYAPALEPPPALPAGAFAPAAGVFALQPGALCVIHAVPFVFRDVLKKDLRRLQRGH